MACRGEPPMHPDLAGIEWRNYSSEFMGFDLEIPYFYSDHPEDDGESVIFRMDGYPVLMISLLGRDRADQRGLWADHSPVATGLLAARPADHYVYDHHDGPFVMRTISWVVPWRGKFLEFALRTEASVPDPVQQHMLDSFKLHNLN
jgi:hypothetical protein